MSLAPARPAATLLLLRDGGRTEVLLTRRSTSARFAPGAYVSQADWTTRGRVRTRWRRVDRRRTMRSYRAIAAIRSFEELGLLLARHPTAAGPARRTSWRSTARVLRRAMRARGLTLAADQVYWLAHWITDRDLPIRFDVPLHGRAHAGGQQPVADGTEQFEPVWLRPQGAPRATAPAAAHDPPDDQDAGVAAGAAPAWTRCSRCQRHRAAAADQLFARGLARRPQGRGDGA